MKKYVLHLLFVLLTTTLFGQAESEYYFQGKDTIIYSNALKENRKITISLPVTFTKEKATKFPVIIVFDSQNKRIYRQTYETINYLVSFDELPESIIIGINSETNYNRYLDTSFLSTNENAKGEKLESFLFDELLPILEKEYNASKIRTFIGHSRFGYYSSYLLTNKINELTSVISMSPFYLQENVNLVDSLQLNLSKIKLKNHVYYRFITGDPYTDTKDYDIMKSFLEQNKIDEKLDWKGLEFYKVQHMAVPAVALPNSLIDVFNYWSEEVTKIQRSELALTKQEYSSFKSKMKKHYGYEMGINLAILNGIAYGYNNDEKYKKAIEVWEILLEEYPMFTYANISISNSFFKLNNKNRAYFYLEKAKLELINNTFYSNEEKLNIQSEIEKIINQ
ncbi:alpha/beta hydrolase-fold protein [Flavobacterium psychraquaticum]|uniref:alpha/beta hydrolase-fold protein n=1 Tax=Flavobacterium psychraquaticum TaxID=3103958 RepID=UPI002ACDE087|nr:alpha/beta hydrolase-fold protein [Flavobacterium sp. LB-N7T]